MVVRAACLPAAAAAILERGGEYVWVWMGVDVWTDGRSRRCVKRQRQDRTGQNNPVLGIGRTYLEMMIYYWEPRVRAVVQE